MAGKVIRFDEIRGYGFITPDNGRDDVFSHAHDLLNGKALYHPGQRVEFEVEDGERGLKASGVRVIGLEDAASAAGGARVAVTTQAAARQAGNDTDAEDGLCDLLSAAEFSLELTEALLLVVPSLTGEQILAVRRGVTELASAHNWIET